MTDSPIDPAVFAALVEMTGGEMDFVDELIDTYLDDGEAQLGGLREAITTGDPAELVRPAHSLKASSLNVGALELGGLCRELEERARHGAVPDVADRVAAIALGFGRARVTLLTERAARLTA